MGTETTVYRNCSGCLSFGITQTIPIVGNEELAHTVSGGLYRHPNGSAYAVLCRTHRPCWLSTAICSGCSTCCGAFTLRFCIWG